MAERGQRRHLGYSMGSRKATGAAVRSPQAGKLTGSEVIGSADVQFPHLVL